MESSQYIWRTEQDDQVRSHHASREGKVFSWNDPPPGGHPGEDYNCRCWAEEKECRGLWLKNWEIAEKLKPWGNKVFDLGVKIHNTKEEIKELKSQIELLEKAVAIPTLAARILKQLKHPATEAGQVLAKVAHQKAKDELEKRKAILADKTTYLQYLETEMQLAKSKVETVKIELERAVQAYDECTGKASRVA